MARLVLTGMPTAGKTVTGRLVAKRLGARFVDVDEAIEASEGRTVAAIFAKFGEARFRALESTAAIEALGEDDAVVALGGGAVTQPAIVEMLRGQTVVWLDVTVEAAKTRAARQGGQRPLLSGDVADRLTALDAERRGLYAKTSTWRVDTTGRTPDQVASIVARLADVKPIRVPTDHPYDAVVATDATLGLAPLVAGAAKVAIIASPAMKDTVARVRAEVEATGAQSLMIEVPVGEAAKTPATLADCWSKLAAADFTRSDLVVGVGGGATTDFAGFLAASYLRGIGWVAVPTTVLGMVDAAVGGKTGIDLPEGKNLVGAFHEPRAVLADLDALKTLPAREVASGLAEAVKEGFTDDAAILDLVETDSKDALDIASTRIADIIRRAVTVKARVVGDDLRERTTASGAAVGRERLNYGHTLGHAIEALENFTWRHGEAVAVGCVFAAEMAHRVLGLPRAVVDRHRAVLESLGLPTSYHGASFDDLLVLMARDKKTRGASLRMVLLRGIGDVVIVKDPPEDALRDAFTAIQN